MMLNLVIEFIDKWLNLCEFGGSGEPGKVFWPLFLADFSLVILMHFSHESFQNENHAPLPALPCCRARDLAAPLTHSARADHRTNTIPGKPPIDATPVNDDHQTEASSSPIVVLTVGRCSPQRRQCKPERRKRCRCENPGTSTARPLSVRA